jgi:hypothetical protein
MWLLSNAPTRRTAEPSQRILVTNEHIGTKGGHINTIHIAIRYVSLETKMEILL